MEHACGGETVFCPLGSAEPSNVTDHHYATGGGVVTRQGQLPCLGAASSPPAGGVRVGGCPSTTAPLNGQAEWYDATVDGREYTRDVNEQGVEQ